MPSRAIIRLALLCPLLTVCSDSAAQEWNLRFERRVLSSEFNSEGACFADINGDGVTDAVSGAFWYPGPTFEQRHRYALGGPYSITAYSNFFFTFADDFDGDGDTDILSIPMPGTPAYWHENPGSADDLWPTHMALDGVGGESPALVDITGDGNRELVCIHNEAWGFAEPHRSDSAEQWKFTPISGKRGLGRFTHGQGVGEINGDGRLDFFERTGWWEAPHETAGLFKFHKFPFAKSGGSQMFAYDFDGDGDNDVVSVQNAHAWGLSWFERRGGQGDVGFIEHEILPNKPNVDGSSFNISQMHALALADMDGDGVKDIVTGKRYFAHNGNDPGAHQLPLLVWFRTLRTTDGVVFEPHVIDKLAGVGTQLTVADINKDKRPDIIVGNKRGTTLFLNQGNSEAPASVLSKTDKQIGTNRFAAGVRETDAMTPEEELATFVLPPGFEVSLVAAEPDIAKPMNLAFDHRGRLWVSSSEEYPYAAPADRDGRDTIKVFEDADGDGRFEKKSTFADGLNIPIGLYPYKDGVVCYSIPNIWFLRDTTGDGRADKREKLYGPMGFERDTHGMCNGFTRGYDGWLYACHGFNNHTTVAGRDGHEVKMQSGNTFRMRLDGSRIEHFTHGLVNPFGMTFDEYGDQFVADCHTKPVTLLLRGGYYDSFGKPDDGLGYVPNVMDHLHGSTAIGGIARATGQGFPDAFRGNLFGGNVMTSRINRNSVHRSGSTIRVREEPDFLVAGDPWFRPVDLQFGPDGALYVADFYNRIIGHYEVKLDHPGRDRKSGRIWRIAYTGTRTQDSSDSDGPGLPPEDSLEQLVAAFKQPNLQSRMLASDRITDHFGDSAVDALRDASASKNADARIHSLWALARLDALTPEQLEPATEHADDQVRTHALRILESLATSAKHADLITTGLRDKSGIVRRAAAIAATVHQNKLLIKELLSALRSTADSDVHLHHALRMAIRDHLRNEDWFKETMASVEQADVPVLAGICLALKTEHAGEFLARHLEKLPTKDSKEFTEYLKFAARYVSVHSVDSLVATAAERFKGDSDQQIELLRSVDAGLRDRGVERPESVTRWATSLAKRLLGDPDADHAEPIGWTAIGQGGQEVKEVWSVSTKRNSADGQSNSRLLSSFPAGENATGTYRSAPFTLGDEFSFYMAGHDGFPDKKLQGRNFVRLRDATTLAVIKSWSPPRNDTAQHFSWQTGPDRGRRVIVELVDGDTAGAYAWLAVGRFSEEGLNPRSDSRNRKRGITICRDMNLVHLRPQLVQIIRSVRSSRQSAALAADAVSRMSGDTRLEGLARTMTFASTPDDLCRRSGEVVADVTAGDVTELLREAFKTSTTDQQLQVARILASDVIGARTLLTMIENGRASTGLLHRAEITTKIQGLRQPQLVKRVLAIAPNHKAEDPAIQKRITNRIRDYMDNPGDRNRGIALFTKHCAACHQVAGQGKKVGPNLDGIGTRGLNRMAEDVLAPSRNVDINFRATTIVTTDGKVQTGLLLETTGARAVLVNGEGQQVSIPNRDIEEKTTSRLSPMPSNVAEKLSRDEFRDLMSYLLSLGGNTGAHE